MGVTAAAAEFLIEARMSGADFERTLTIGRQGLFASPHTLRAMLDRHACWPAGQSVRDFYASFTSPLYVDPFLHALGAREVTAMDAADYEGAELVHDLNHPVPADLHERYSVVFDGGSLEHVFNIPVALANCMEMVAPGGHLILYVVANNAFGHGFYQFSPELFFRALCADNGFELERMVALEHLVGLSKVLGCGYAFQTGGGWYEVKDPRAVGERHVLISRRPVELLVCAKRTEVTTVFASYPQQSDYVALWNKASKGVGASRGLGRRALAALRQAIPAHLRARLSLDLLPRAVRPLDPLRYRHWARMASFDNRSFFTPVRPAAASAAKKRVLASVRRRLASPRKRREREERA